jgi:hypothetical protein
MSNAENPWTFAAYLVLDVAGETEEATLLKIGDARLSGGNLLIELVPGVALSGRIVLKLKEEHSA